MAGPPVTGSHARWWVARVVPVLLLVVAFAVDFRGAFAGPAPTSASAPARVEDPAATSPPARVGVPPPPARAETRPDPSADAGTPSAARDPAEPRRVRVPALGIDAEVLAVGLDADGRLQVPAAATTVGWWSGGSAPSQEGPTVLVGHVDWRGELGVFHALARLETGDVIDVEDEEGRTSRSVVTAVEQHAKAAFPTDAVYGETAGPSLRLVTCAGPFDRTTGHYPDNLIVFAAPVSDPRPSAAG